MTTYNHLNEFYKNKFGERTLKICIDGGFSCPNRDGTKAYGGCIFCSSKGSGERIDSSLSINEQVTSFLNSYKGKRANKFIAYFQSYTNTYAPVDILKKKYDEALCDERIIGLDIDTRADYINEDVCKLLASYQNKYYVLVELGVQSSSEATHTLINQQITNEEIRNAISLLNKYHIDVVLHIMVGLPNETHEDIVNTVAFLNTLNYQGIKIHSTYVIKDTVLGYLYEQDKYHPLTCEDYINEVIYILLHISKDIIVHRITGDPPKDELLAPSWATHKKIVLNAVENYFRKNNISQGALYKK